jgi:hypothetical protein
MNVKFIGTIALLVFVGVSVGYLLVGESRTRAARPGDMAADGPSRTPEGKAVRVADGGHTTGPTTRADKEDQRTHKVIAYYFHNTQRCMTCNKIERLAEEALREQFSEALKEGGLEWRTVNMEEPANTHFVQEYQLVASSLVLVDLHDGQTRAWTNMGKVWEYVHDDEAQFKRYVAEQARKYLESPR